MQGQINIGSTFGDWLTKCAADPRVSTIVEIGTWNGMGSTQCILKGSDGKSLISIESNPKMFSVAEVNLRGAVLELLYGRVIEREDLITTGLSLEQERWLKQDLDGYDKCPNILSELPKEIDFLVLDGGEFSTRAEFLKLIDRVKVYVALDDTKCLKNRQNREDLMADESFQLIVDGQERNGFSIFARK